MVSDVIYIHRQKMSGEELLMRYRLVNDGIKTIKKLNPPVDCTKVKGELADEMNQLLVDLFDIKKRMEKNLNVERTGSLT